MSEESSSDELPEEDFDEDFSDMRIAPYQFEPEISAGSCKSKEADKEKARERAGKTFWCVCGFCKSMETEVESLYCLENNDISDNVLAG